MGDVTILAPKAVIALGIAGAVGGQAVLLPATWNDLSNAETPTWAQVSVVSTIAAAVVALQVCAVCGWRLPTLVRSGSVFSEAA